MLSLLPAGWPAPACASRGGELAARPPPPAARRHCCHLLLPPCASRGWQAVLMHPIPIHPPCRIPSRRALVHFLSVSKAQPAMGACFARPATSDGNGTPTPDRMLPSRHAHKLNEYKAGQPESGNGPSPPPQQAYPPPAVSGGNDGAPPPPPGAAAKSPMLPGGAVRAVPSAGAFD